MPPFLLLLSFLFVCLFCFFFWSFRLFRVAPMAHENSQARGWIGAVVTGLSKSYSNAGSSHICDLHHSSGQGQIPKPLSEARDRTHVLMDASWVRQLLSHDGNVLLSFFQIIFLILNILIENLFSLAVCCLDKPCFRRKSGFCYQKWYFSFTLLPSTFKSLQVKEVGYWVYKIL